MVLVPIENNKTIEKYILIKDSNKTEKAELETNQSLSDININYTETKKIINFLKEKGLFNLKINNVIVGYKDNDKKIFSTLQEANIIEDREDFDKLRAIIDDEISSDIQYKIFDSEISMKYYEYHKYHKYYKYFIKSGQCGVAIKNWDDAKEYCNILEKRLPSINELKEIDIEQYCNWYDYWSNEINSTKVNVYHPYKNKVLKKSKKDTFIAKCY